MIMLQVDLKEGYRKANLNNLPLVSSEAIFNYIAKAAAGGKKNAGDKTYTELLVDYVQLKKFGDVCDVEAIVFPINSTDGSSYIGVSLKVNEEKNDIFDTKCDKCELKSSCAHVLAFIFWLHRKSNDTAAPSIRDFWGSETEHLLEEEQSDALRLRDIYAIDPPREEADIELSNVTEEEGSVFLNGVLDEMENLNLIDTAFYKHCRNVESEYEPIFIHHSLLDARKNCIKDPLSFNLHMEDQAKKGLFEKLADESKHSYRSPLWLEVQYGRLRCSLIHRITLRKSSQDDQPLLEAIFNKGRESTAEERQRQKVHKRFILKQTEKLENKVYRECGLLLNESYPYICATPDGITDDHIVEIKAPKTEEEFEQYLEFRETIAPKYMAQIQIQMYMANVTRALYCVLSPTFDANGALHYVWVQADMEFVATLLSAAEDFWKEVVFPKLHKIYIEKP